MDIKLNAFSDIANSTPEQLFETDTLLATADGATNAGVMPYYKHISDEKGVLLIHGFCASPHELLPLTQELESRGLSVYAVRVAGHGTNPNDLIKKTYADWYESIAYGYNALRKSCKKVIVVGQSNGGLLASAVAISNKTDGLCLLAPAYKVRIPLFGLVKYVRGFIKGFPRPITAEEKLYNYDIFPSQPLYQMMLLQKLVKSHMNKISVPLMMSVSENDVLISPQEALKCIEMTNSVDKTIKLYNNKELNVQHILTKRREATPVQNAADWIEKAG